MTTNSPNPVDGDVQALIAFLKEKVASLKLAVKQRAFENVRDELVMELKSAEISLAALTAEPADRIVDDGCSQRIGCVPVSDTLNCTWPLGTQFYTTPPAQLLRPVELPEPYDDGHGNLWLPQDAVIYAVKNAGGEVKS